MPNFACILRSLYGRLTLLILVISSLLGGTLILFAQKSADQSRLEVMQGVNRSTAMYITQQAPLITFAGVQEERMSELAQRAMIINPSLEIYVLDTQGKILSHRMPDGTEITSSIDVTPIHAFLQGGLLPIYGEDPRRPGEKAVFSVSPIKYQSTHLGYVYAVIGGEIYQTLQNEANLVDSQHLFLLLAGMAIVSAALVGGILVFFMTRPLGLLSQRMKSYQAGDAVTHEDGWDTGWEGGTEIRSLKQSFENMQQTINQQVDAITQLDQTRRELIANVSHDLRTPLAALQGSLEWMIIKEESLTPEQQQSHTHAAFKQSQRLTRLVGDLFELAKLESGGMEVNLETFSVSELLQDCSHDLAHLAEQKGVRLELTLESEMNLQVHADIGLIQRVLENLISNAIQHTPEGGVVTLSVESSETGAKVAVADTGVGISSSALPHIFDRFYQAKDTEHSSQIGSGLGLAIVKRILSIHKASIEVTSQLNKGTRFQFELEG